MNEFKKLFSLALEELDTDHRRAIRTRNVNGNLDGDRVLRV